MGHKCQLWIATLLLAIGCRGGTSAADEDCGREPCGAGATCDMASGECYCDPGNHGDPRDECVPHGDLCAEAAARVGHGVCAHELGDETDWNATTIPYAKRDDVDRVGKYLVPAVPDADLPSVFLDINHYRLHFCMLKEAFEPQFPGYVFAQYNWDVYFRERRQMFAGSIYELLGDDLPAPYGFLIETPDDPEELLTQQEVYDVYRTLQDRFGAGELAYLPFTDAQQERAATWQDPPFAIVVEGDAAVSFEPYTPGVAYGRVRRYTANEVATASGTFGSQDIVVLETTSATLQGVNAGVVTGTRQDLLSHLNVLAAQRGTPNAFVADPLDAFARFDGELVRLDVTDETYTVAPTTVDEAEAFWAEHRPSVSIERAPDAAYTELVGLLELPTDSQEDRSVAVSRFGGKATGLATLYKTLDPAYQAQGFAIPVAHYLKFMQTNTWEAPVGETTQTLTYAETVSAWLADETFMSDTRVRRQRLDALTEHMRDKATVDPVLVAALYARVVDVFGDETVMVRFRSSSNVEDGVEFNGAGLYESTRACVADHVEGGQSACDPSSASRPIYRALRRVWASLWGFGAFEEREYFQIDHRDAAMAVLVSTRFKDERANGVVFTGNPLDKEDERITVNAQLGETDVVETSPGLVAELDRLTIHEGAVVGIDRVSSSSLLPQGGVVLTDGQLREIGSVVAEIAATYPVTTGAVAPQDVLLDLEFKIDASGRLVFKQIRPFVPSAVDPSFSRCELE